MKTCFSFNFPGGKKVNNRKTAQSGTTVTFTVPTGKRWLVLYGFSERDTSGTFDAMLNDGTNDIGHLCDQVAAGTTDVYLPNDAHWPCRPLLDPGEKVVYTYGASQTSNICTLVVLEIDIT